MKTEDINEETVLQLWDTLDEFDRGLWGGYKYFLYDFSEARRVALIKAAILATMPNLPQ